MTEAVVQQHAGENAGERTPRRVVWALVGGVFVLDAFVMTPFAAGDGTVPQAVALIGLIILFVPMVRIVLADAGGERLRMNELAILAVVASVARGDLVMAGAVAFILLITLIVESRTASGAQASLEALARLSPGLARRVCDDGTEEAVAPATLCPGDRLRLRPGENVLADGEIVRGTTSLNEATITGESLPADKGPGDTVFAGTINLTGALEVRVTRAGSDTTLGKVRELILAAEKTRLPVVRLIDQYVSYYIPAVLIVGVLVWTFTQDLDRLVSLFIVASPAALFLSTPSAMVAALSAAARAGVLIKNVSDIETAARITAFVFDKTGTLTRGELTVARLAPAEGVESAELLTVAASAERSSNHPVAVAIRALAEKAKVSLEETGDLHEEPGRGIRARVGDREVLVGNWAWAEENGAARGQFPDFGPDRTAGMSLLFVLADGRALGWVGLSDALRPEAGEALTAIREAGVPGQLLVTGDRSDVARKVADELEIERWHGDCVPGDKVRVVEEAKASGSRVAFVGDGVNDGPALAASHIGIAMGAAGSDVALESASVALMNNDLRRLPMLIRLSRCSRRVIIQNVCLGGVIVAGGIGASAMGMLSPLLAALLQAGGAVAVVLNSARLVRLEEQQTGEP